MELVRGRPSSLATALALALGLALAAKEADGQRLGIALGPVHDRADHLGGHLQVTSRVAQRGALSLLLELSYSQVRLPGFQIPLAGDGTGDVPATFDRTYHAGVEAQYRLMNSRVSPYAVAGLGMYARNSWSGDYSPGFSYGVGAEGRLAGAMLFTELRLHTFWRDARDTPQRQTALIPLVFGIRF